MTTQLPFWTLIIGVCLQGRLIYTLFRKHAPSFTAVLLAAAGAFCVLGGAVLLHDLVLACGQLLVSAVFWLCMRDVQR
ncbi:hypothetical protein SAMN02745702_00150 [Desulfobaculum bizertense DSM 18034]|uniref:Uncharacterized protein n=1 Tax=Desulfobaculum bizertense DSM 18034 TaxID=1121442 RepID=A0A1T4VF32_9BACT|nr:hypothetical protein SAMN02745702_00150 [Desulfobaculum bizertense DSM 18034]